MIHSSLHHALADALGSPPASVRKLDGGDINLAFEVTLRGDQRIFLKTHPSPPKGLYPREAEGLAWLADAHALRVPEVLAISDGTDAAPPFLALEFVEPSNRARDFDERVGRGLAALHRAGPQDFGFEHDNFIGTLPQPNAKMQDWAQFYGEQRLAPLVARASAKGLFDSGARRDFDRLFDKLPTLVGDAEAPARLHGDLWGGNLHCDEKGYPVLIDPAVYGGHREVDLAMMRLFGGFSGRVFDAYEECFPLSPGASRRIALYQLYPLLVHANLFGRGYAKSCLDAVALYL